MENKIYQVYTNLSLDIREVNYIRKTESTYWVEGERYSHRLDTDYVKSFDTKEEAIDYLKNLLESKLMSIKSTFDYYNEQLDKFNKLYKTHEK